jgi:Flp pilus assembly protein TadG
MKNKSNNFFNNKSGNIAVIFALSALPLMAAVGGAIQLNQMSSSKALIQLAADEAALAGATRMSIARAGMGFKEIENTAKSTAESVLARSKELSNATINTEIDDKNGLVIVNVKANFEPTVSVLGNGSGTIDAVAQAETLNDMPLCVMQTDRRIGGTDAGIRLWKNARIEAPGCVVHSNRNIGVFQSASLRAGTVRAEGRIIGNVSPKGQSGALPIKDPFEKLDLGFPFDPNSKKKARITCPGRADAGNVIIDKPTLLNPGVHCENYYVIGNGELNLAPGEHYFDNYFVARDNSKVIGDDVVMIFTDIPYVAFQGNTNIRLAARKSGPFAGFVMATGRHSGGNFRIESSRVDKLLGVIYFPKATLLVSTNGTVSEDSQWSIIVAREIRLDKNPVLFINKDYSTAKVPVPAGVGVQTSVRLKK